MSVCYIPRLSQCKDVILVYTEGQDYYCMSFGWWVHLVTNGAEFFVF